MNFLHLFSRDTVGYWVHAEDSLIFALVLNIVENLDTGR